MEFTPKIIKSIILCGAWILFTFFLAFLIGNLRMNFMIFALVGAIFFIIGIAWYNGKGIDGAAGWNILAESQKLEYDQEKLFSFMGLLIIASAVPLLLGFIIAYTNFYLGLAFITAFILLLVGGIVYANTGERFKLCKLK